VLSVPSKVIVTVTLKRSIIIQYNNEITAHNWKAINRTICYLHSDKV